MSDLILGIMMRAHRRDFTLDIALSEWRRIGTLPGLRTKITVLLDRPTYFVNKVIDKHKPYLFRVEQSPFPLVSPTGEAFMQAANLQLEWFNSTDIDILSIVDDDFWFEPLHATTELPTALHNPDIDMWYANAVFMWNSSNQFNAARRHCSPIFYRRLEGDTYPLDRIIHATALRHDEAIMLGRTSLLKTPILEHGCINQKERLQLYQTFAEAGKKDSFIESLVAPLADLRTFPQDAVPLGLMPDARWRDLYHEKELRNASA